MLMHEDLDIQSGNYITLYHRVDGKIKARRWVNPLWNVSSWLIETKGYYEAGNPEHNIDVTTIAINNVTSGPKYLNPEEVRRNNPAGLDDVIIEYLGETKTDLINLFQEIAENNGIHSVGLDLVMWQWNDEYLKSEKVSVRVVRINLATGIGYQMLDKEHNYALVPIVNFKTEQLLYERFFNKTLYATKEECDANNQIEIVDFAG